MTDWDDAPYVCPGCYAIGGEPHAGYCIDAEIEREAEEERTYGRRDDDDADRYWPDDEEVIPSAAMVDHPVTSAFLATIRACSWVAPTDASPIAHVRVGAGPELWIRISDQGDGHWSFGAADGAWSIDVDVFADIFAAKSADADGRYVRADETHVELQAVAATHAAEPDSPPPPPIPH